MTGVLSISTAIRHMHEMEETQWTHCLACSEMLRWRGVGGPQALDKWAVIRIHKGPGPSRVVDFICVCGFGWRGGVV